MVYGFRDLGFRGSGFPDHPGPGLDTTDVKHKL